MLKFWGSLLGSNSNLNTIFVEVKLKFFHLKNPGFKYQGI